MIRKILSRIDPVLIVTAVIGALAGYLYYRFVGCVTGTCPITSSPVNSTLYGAVMGGCLSVFISPFFHRDQQKPPAGLRRPSLPEEPGQQ